MFSIRFKEKNLRYILCFLGVSLQYVVALVVQAMIGRRGMRVHYELAEFLVAAWQLTRSGERLPTSHGILDRALAKSLDEMPPRLAEALTFVETPVGRLCVDVPDILRAAQESYLTSEPNPTYKTSEVKVSTGEAKELLRDLGVGVAEARKFGEALSAAMETEILEVANL